MIGRLGLTVGLTLTHSRCFPVIDRRLTMSVKSAGGNGMAIPSGGRFAVAISAVVISVSGGASHLETVYEDWGKHTCEYHILKHHM